MRTRYDPAPPAATTTSAGIARRTSSKVYFQLNVASAADTNAPVNKHEWVANTTTRRQPADLRGFEQVRLVHQTSTTAGAAGSKVSAQFSLDGGSTWTFLDGTADGAIGAATPQTPYDTAIGTLATSAWATLAAAARAEVLLRIVTSGDGVADPIMFQLYLEFV